MIINPSVKSVSVLGCGWFGLPLARRLVQAGFIVSGSTTTHEKINDLQDAGIDPYLLDFKPGISANKKPDLFFDTDVLVITIPPSIRSGQGSSRYRLMIDNLMPHIASSGCRHVIFISSTSVYADLNRVVKEEDAGKGDLTEAGNVLFDIENTFLDKDEFDTTVLRFGGLYGPGRHPANYLSGKQNLANPEGPVNLVQLEDCIRVTERIIRLGKGNQIFSVVSDKHPSRKEYYTKVCELLGLPLPSFREQSDEDNWKQVTNRKLRSTLNYQFKYASPFEGISR